MPQQHAIGPNMRDRGLNTHFGWARIRDRADRVGCDHPSLCPRERGREGARRTNRLLEELDEKHGDYGMWNDGTSTK